MSRVISESLSDRIKRSLGDATFLQRLALPAVIVVIALVTGWVEPRYWTSENMMNLARQLAPLMIISVGQAFAVISGGLDLSVAAVLALGGVVGAIVMLDYGIAAGLFAMIVTGSLAGLVNGVIITRFDVSPFIVTLGMLSMAKGLALMVAGGLPIYNIPDAFVDFVGYGRILGLPVGAVLALGAVALGWFLLGHTIFGRYVYAIGSNSVAAANSGVNVRFYTVLVYVLSGTMAGVAAVVMTSWVAAAQPLAAEGLELKSLAAVVVGGVALTGGTGSMFNVFFGVLILGMLTNSLNMIGVSSFMQVFAIGLVIVAAAVLDRIRARAR